ncbi:DNA repair exonuclease SbcCD ATPase subunit [Sphingopyxis sp. YR583]|uniref:ATP-binding protein n=1 Tax=Sphingopyxis sp. YR583 TaxID=1881047 RepID=UPI0008A7C79C|nr:ATP-binding protein [Sphingopyxis sp. YR583]SEH17155.1 DNA repair exonuclease SbcCD ATPase subunit [Sphingopyxis sp. YR583]
MTRGVRLSSLTVGAFRGIGEVLEFDLRAPLTLVFAPNGTGKTTMCEAAEWLLTGQVDRLKDKKDFDAEVLRSKFTGPEQKPHVAANVQVGGTAYQLSRIAEGSQSPAAFEIDGLAVPQRPNDLLALLAPAAAANEAHHLTAISLRQRWLKGTRFLSAEALAALVDTDDETIERRTQVFADLLGIRHLLDAERQFEKYAAELSSRLRAQVQLTQQRAAEADAIEKELDRNMSPATTAASATGEVAQAEILLRAAAADIPPSDAPFPDRLEALTALQRRGQHENERRRNALGAVEVRRTSRAALEQAVAGAKATELKLDAELAEIGKNGQAAAAKAAASESERQSITAASQALAAAGDRLARRAAAMLSTIHRALVFDPVPATLGALRAGLPETGWTSDARAERRALLTDLSAGLEQADREAERLRLLDVEREVASAATVSEAAFAVLRAEAADAERRAAAANQRRDAAAAPLSRLQSAARDLLAHDHSHAASSCPVCAHDWQTADALRAAITAALATVPELATQAEAAAQTATEAARIATERLKAAHAANARLATLDRERATLSDAAERRGLSLRNVGLPAAVSAGELDLQRVRLDIADALAVLDEEIAVARPMVSAELAQLLPDQIPLSDLVERVSAQIGARDHVLQLQLAGLVRNSEEATTLRDRLRAEYAGIQQRLRDCREQLAAKGSELAELQALWDIAAPEQSWSEAAFAQLKTELTKEQDELARAEAHIEAARAAWTAEARRTQLVSLRAAIKPALDQQSRMTARIAAATRAQATFQDTYTKISKRQVQDLAKVVNPLFARMHANRVYDRINLGEDSEFLHWLAHAGDAQLDPGKDFSQGQRQDLALALFLARARSLGGTFFLDEPVAHLDDLNRVGLLDILRATVLEESRSVNLVITTSSRALARHLIEKFACIDAVETVGGPVRPLSVIELDGNSRSGVGLKNIYPLN